MATVVFTKMRPYYRRTIKSHVGIGGIAEFRLRDSVAIYFRDAKGQKVAPLIVEPESASLFETGETYTIEVTR